jgi:hypothetical protein
VERVVGFKYVADPLGRVEPRYLDNVVLWSTSAVVRDAERRHESS